MKAEYWLSGGWAVVLGGYFGRSLPIVPTGNGAMGAMNFWNSCPIAPIGVGSREFASGGTPLSKSSPLHGKVEAIFLPGVLVWVVHLHQGNGVV